MRSLRLSRGEMLRLGRGRIATRTLQRVINAHGARLSLSTGEALAEILGCGCLDVFLPSPHLANRIARFGLQAHALAGPATRGWVSRPEEAALAEALALRKPIVIVGPARSGKTSLVARVVATTMAQFPYGTLWVSGDAAPAAARASLAECLMLFPAPSARAGSGPGGSEPDQRFARVLWSRPRLLVVDAIREAAWAHQLLGRHRGPMDLVLLVESQRTALELERELGARVLRLEPLQDAQVLAFLQFLHGGDARLASPAAPGRLRAEASPRALVGEAAALRRLQAVAAALRDSDAGWRALFDAVAGRPDAMLLAGDLVASTRFRTLGEIAEIVGASTDPGERPLPEASATIRKVLGCLAFMEGTAVPMDWVTTVAEVQANEARAACDELAGGIVDGTPGSPVRSLALASQTRQLARRAVDAAERALMSERIGRKALQVARDLAALPPEAALGALFSQEGALVVGLRHLAAGASPSATPQALVEALSALGRILPASRREELEGLLEAGCRAAEANGLPLEALRLRQTLGRWLVAARNDFVGAEGHFQASAEGFAVRALHVEAADAFVDAAVARFATLRTAGGTELVRRAADHARKASPAPVFLARHLANQAVGESRLRGGVDGLEGWRRARTLLDEAVALVAGVGAGDEAIRCTIACNRAVAGAVLELPGWKANLRTSLRTAMASPALGPFEAYHLASAEAAGLLLARSRDEQRRRLRAPWLRMLRSQGADVPESIRRLGEMAFYLNNLETGDGNAWHANGGVLATDATPVHARGARGVVPLTFFARPLLQVFDARLLEATKRFFWQQGGPRLSRALAEVEALRQKVTQRPVRRGD